jgi:tRNA pseudouridine38-40 synthase
MENKGRRKDDAADVAGADEVRLRLTVGYEGTHYKGWQLQSEGPTVQGVIEESLAKIFPSHPQLHSSSRTDAGVHAIGMAAHFDVTKAEWRMEPSKLILALNAHLPEDVRVLTAAKAKRDFHARFDAVGKQYRYFIWNHSAQTPLWRATHWHVPRTLDVRAMSRAAASLEGRHDFIAFSASPGYARNHTCRNVRRCEVKRNGSQIVVIIEADGFLYKMCRGIVGTLAQVGMGRFQPEQVLPMIESRNRSLAGMTAPAHGLILWKVFYRKSGEPRRPHPADVSPVESE